MPKLYSSKDIISILNRFNFEFVNQKGSHGKYRNSEGRTVIVPMNRREIPLGTFRSIIKQSGIDVKEFMENLR
jgi:predicted RNA binding protein YcfA (HicA-like mRNA interferase family)